MTSIYLSCCFDLEEQVRRRKMVEQLFSDETEEQEFSAMEALNGYMTEKNGHQPMKMSLLLGALEEAIREASWVNKVDYKWLGSVVVRTLETAIETRAITSAVFTAPEKAFAKA